jgi:peptidoglycan/LPS O-acetylase OafA/YrhL
MTLNQLATSRDNNFNLIRFIAASLVLFSHSYPLAMGKGYPEPLSVSLGTTWGAIAVDVFFIASGFFIAASFSYKTHLKSFVMARALRIFPGLLLVTILTACILGPVFSSLSITEYFSDYHWLQYLVKNSLLITGIEYNLPGVFTQNPYPLAVNGSLWTLPYEIKMYFLLVIFCSLFSHIQQSLKLNANTSGRLIAGLSLSALCLHLVNYFQEFYQGEFLKLFCMFFMGSSFFFFKEKIHINNNYGLTFIIILLISCTNQTAFFFTYTLFLAYIVFYLAYVPKGAIRSFNALGDYSYGIYIYAFPVQQIVAVSIPGISILGMISLSFLITLLLAYLSWNLIEERALKLKRHFK